MQGWVGFGATQGGRLAHTILGTGARLAIDGSSPKNRKRSVGSYGTSAMTADEENENPEAQSGEGTGASGTPWQSPLAQHP